MELQLDYIDLIYASQTRLKSTKIVMNSNQDVPALYWSYPVLLTGNVLGITININMSGAGYIHAHEIQYEYDDSKINIPSESMIKFHEQINAIIDRMVR